MGSLGDTLPKPKKYNTELTDYSTVHDDKTGPYADNLEVDALIVGAGFGEFSRYPRPMHSPKLTNSKPACSC